MLNPNLSSSTNQGSKKVLIMVFALVAILALYYFLNKRSDDPTTDVSPQAETQEEIMARQMEELNKLRKETPPLTQEQISSQAKELEKLRKQTPALTQEQLEKQAEELNKLRSQI